MPTILRWPILIAAVVLAAGVAGIAATLPVILQGTDGQPACVVEMPSASASTLAVDVREPAEPASALLDELPADARDFSSVPMAVRLDDPASAGTAPKLPATIEAAVRQLDVAGVDSRVGFVRAMFPRLWLAAGTVIVGERSRVAPGGHRVSTQTRCTITAADEAHWR